MSEKHHSSIRVDGVSGVLKNVRDAVVKKLRERLIERRDMGRNELPDEEIDSICSIAGMIAKQAAADGVGESYQLGVNRSVKAEEHSAETVRAPADRSDDDDDEGG